MSQDLGDAVLVLRADDQMSGDIDKAGRNAGSKISAAGAGMVKAGAGLTLGLTAPIVAFGKIAADELGEIQRVNAQTTAGIKSTGGAANVTAKHIQGMAGKLQQLSGVDDQVIQSGSNMLLTFTKIRNEAGKGNDIFDQATKAALNLSVKGFGSMDATSKMLGKALNDPVKGITAMSRAGVTFTAGQKKQIKAMAESGDMVGAQKLILAELEVQVGGAAEAAGKTFPAQLAVLKDSFAGVGAALLATLMPTLKDLTGFLTSGLAAFQGLSPEMKKVVAVGLVLAAALGPVLMVAGSLAMMLPAVGAALAAISLPAVAVFAAIIALGAALIYAWKTSETFRTGVIQIWNQVKAAVSSVVSSLKQTIRQWVVWANQLWAAHGASIKATAKTMWDAVRQIISGAINVVKGVLNTALAIMRGDWSAAWAGFKTILSGAWDIIKGVVRLGVEAVKTLLKTGWEGAKKLTEKAWSELPAIISKALRTAAIMTLANSILVGMRIVEGIKQGVLAAAQALATAAVKVVMDAISAAERAAGIASPSKVAAKRVGEPLGQGVALGLKRSSKAAEKAAKELMDRVVRVMDRLAAKSAHRMAEIDLQWLRTEGMSETAVLDQKALAARQQAASLQQVLDSRDGAKLGVGKRAEIMGEIAGLLQSAREWEEQKAEAENAANLELVNLRREAIGAESWEDEQHRKALNAIRAEHGLRALQPGETAESAAEADAAAKAPIVQNFDVKNPVEDMAALMRRAQYEAAHAGG